MIKRFTFRYWKGPLHYAGLNKNREMCYGDHPKTEMVFICNRRNNVIELRNEGGSLSLNALTSHVCDKNHIDITVRTLGENGTILSPIIGHILQRLKTKRISKNEARKIAKEWIHLNPYVRKDLVKYGLIDRKTLRTCSDIPTEEET